MQTCIQKMKINNIDSAFIRDESLRHLGAVVKRSRNTGDAVIYYQDGTIKHEDIKGDEI